MSKSLILKDIYLRRNKKMSPIRPDSHAISGELIL